MTNPINTYFPDLSSTQQEQFAKAEEAYREWNEKINVVSRKDMDSFLERHILHSLGIAKVMQFTKGTKVLDIGTGGGFPGIPLAIMFPEVDFVLVDSIGKKIKVVDEVAKAIGLKNVRAIHARAEDIKEKFDFIVSRAVTHIDNFIPWTKGKLLSKNQNELDNGILYLKGGDLAEEFQNFPKSKFYNLSDFFTEEFFETKKVVYLREKDL